MGCLIPDKTTEYHDDGSRTDRYEGGYSVTKDSGGNVVEDVRPEHVFGYGPVTTTYDGDGNRINMQDRKD